MRKWENKTDKERENEIKGLVIHIFLSKDYNK